MTVLMPHSYDFDDSDLAKSLGLLDGCDAFPWPGTPQFLEDGFDDELFSLPPLSAPRAAARVPEMPQAAAGADVSHMVPLDGSGKRSPSPASSGAFGPECTRMCAAVSCLLDASVSCFADAAPPA